MAKDDVTVTERVFYDERLVAIEGDVISKADADRWGVSSDGKGQPSTYSGPVPVVVGSEDAVNHEGIADGDHTLTTADETPESDPDTVVAKSAAEARKAAKAPVETAAE